MTAVDQSSRRIKTPVILKAQLLLGNQVAMALFIGRGPIFILCLFFQPERCSRGGCCTESALCSPW